MINGLRGLILGYKGLMWGLRRLILDLIEPILDLRGDSRCERVDLGLIRLISGLKEPDLGQGETYVCMDGRT